GPYQGVDGVFASYCGAIERCDLGLANGYAFECRQECVAAFSFGMTCDLVEEENDRDRFDRRVAPREVSFDAMKGARCADWLDSADCSAIGAMLASGDQFDEDGPEACRGVADKV